MDDGTGAGARGIRRLDVARALARAADIWLSVNMPLKRRAMERNRSSQRAIAECVNIMGAVVREILCHSANRRRGRLLSMTSEIDAMNGFYQRQNTVSPIRLRANTLRARTTAHAR